MIWQLVKRDPAWRNALIGAPVGAAMCLALPGGLIAMFGWLTGMFWLQSQPQRRASLFQAGLPVLARNLFLGRLLAFLALAWLPAACGAIALLLAGRAPSAALTLVEIAGGLSVLMLVALSDRVREIDGSQWTPAISVGVVWILAYPIAHFVPPGWVLAICAAACLVLFWNIWRQLPASFEVRSAGLGTMVARSDGTARPANIWPPVLRVLFAPRLLGFLPMVLFGAFSGQWLYVAVFCVFPTLSAVTAMPWLLGLPVRRSALMAAIVAPWIAIMLLGFLLGNRYRPEPKIAMEWSGSKRVPDVHAPLELWRAGQGGTIVSPWGESCLPETTTLLGVQLYNPYTIGPGTSERFSEWQFRRATEAFYGRPIDYADYRRKRPPEHSVLRQPRLAILNLAAYAGWVMLLINLLFLSLHWRVWRLTRYGQQVVSGLLVAQVMGIGILDFASKRIYPSNSLVNLLLLRASEALPAGLLAMTLTALVPVILLSWSSVQLFQGVEPPPPVSRSA